MDEQPVALATTIRSPKSCVANLRYGVSPQPAHAPENSNSGWKNCDPFTEFALTAVRTGSGNPRKNSKLARSASRIGACGARASALTPVALSLAGQTTTQSSQPVQSSGA